MIHLSFPKAFSIFLPRARAVFVHFFLPNGNFSLERVDAEGDGVEGVPTVRRRRGDDHRGFGNGNRTEAVLLKKKRGNHASFLWAFCFLPTATAAFIGKTLFCSFDVAR